MSLASAIPRRSFLIRGAGWSAVALAGGVLSGCGGGTASGTAEAAAPQAPIRVEPAPAPTVVSSSAQPINFALNLEYLGAQFHSHAAGGGGLPASLIAGRGIGGALVGARQANLADASIIALAAELATGKTALVETLRAAATTVPAAMPALDLSTAPGSAFARLQNLAQLSNEAFDPYGDDRSYLLGAFLLQHGRAAGYRAWLANAGDAPNAPALGRALADAIYHEALIEAEIAGLSSSDGTITELRTALSRALDSLDHSSADNLVVADDLEDCHDVPDGSGGTIAFSRTAAQLTNLVYLNTAGVPGGFLPNGLNLAA